MILCYTLNFRSSLDIIGRVGFGYDFECGEAPEAKQINEVWDNLVEGSMKPEAITAIIMIRLFPWIVKLPLPALENHGAIRSIVGKSALSIIKDREASGEKGGNDLLSILLEHGSEDGIQGLLDQVLKHHFPVLHPLH